MSSLFETRTGDVVRGALDGLAARHRAIAQNLANVETPGYQPVEVSFEDQLRQMRDRFDEPGLGGSTPDSLNLAATVEDSDTGRADGNGVSIDHEVMRLTENTMTYEAVAQAARMRGELLKSAIREGR
jgi:flagellar basal-body rod protein FlgB